MSESEVAVLNERKFCAMVCDDAARRFLGLTNTDEPTFETLIAREKAGVAEALGRIIRARTEG